MREPFVSPVNPEDDMHERWWPSEQARRHALAALKTEPAADHAVIPMFQPGKEYGIWEVGQVVVTVPGVILLAVNGFEARDGLLSGSQTRAHAELLARAELGAQPGTTGRGVVWQDGREAVYEDLPPARNDRVSVPRCEAHASRGTGTGMCDEPLDANGGCPRASAHIEA